MPSQSDSSSSNQVKEAAEWFRGKYDAVLDEWNAERARFGYGEVPKLRNFFRHFQFLGGLVEQFGAILRMENLPTEISGMTEFFTPGKPFSTAEMKRPLARGPSLVAATFSFPPDGGIVLPKLAPVVREINPDVKKIFKDAWMRL